MSKLMGKYICSYTVNKSFSTINDFTVCSFKIPTAFEYYGFRKTLTSKELLFLFYHSSHPTLRSPNGVARIIFFLHNFSYLISRRRDLNPCQLSITRLRNFKDALPTELECCGKNYGFLPLGSL